MTCNPGFFDCPLQPGIRRLALHGRHTGCARMDPVQHVLPDKQGSPQYETNRLQIICFSIVDLMRRAYNRRVCRVITPEWTE